MRFPERTNWLALSLLLPVLYFATSWFFVTASVSLGETDRAIVWADGSPKQLQALAHRVAANGQFPDGLVSGDRTRIPHPRTCGMRAREFSIGNLRAEEAQAARALLESLASEAGARICLTDTFIINELPELGSASRAGFWSATLLQSMLIPLGIVLAVFLAFSHQLGLRLVANGNTSPAPALGFGLLGVGACFAVMLVLQGVGTLAGFTAPVLPSFSLEALGIALAFALVVVVPVLEEVVFRGWMLPLAERAMSAWPAAALSSLAFAASRLPATPAEMVMQFSLGAIYSAIYLRTRSLMACLLANIGFSALAFLPTGA